MQRTEKDILEADMFPGGVPIRISFLLSVDDIKKILNGNTEKDRANTLAEISFMGAVSYFESFCKDCFACIINICPDLLSRLAHNSHDINIDSIRAIHIQPSLQYKVGFLVTEKYDFGTAGKINSLYKSLINITPFSNKDIQKYNKILSDRNLIVHHGSIYTSSYFEQRLSGKKNSERVFLDSLVINKNDVLEKIQFLESIAQKIVTSSKSALLRQKESGELFIDDVGLKALDCFYDLPLDF